MLSIFAILLNTLRIRGINLQREDLKDAAPLVEQEFLVPGMVCEGCATKISTALTALPGVQQVNPKVPQKRIYVRYEPTQVQQEQLRDALDKVGFTAIEA